MSKTNDISRKRRKTLPPRIRKPAHGSCVTPDVSYNVWLSSWDFPERLEHFQSEWLVMSEFQKRAWFVFLISQASFKKFENFNTFDLALSEITEKPVISLKGRPLVHYFISEVVGLGGFQAVKGLTGIPLKRYIEKSLRSFSEQIVQVGELFGFDRVIKTSSGLRTFKVDKYISHLETITEQTMEGWFKIAKYKLNAFYNHWTFGTSYPKPYPFSSKADTPGVLLGGRFYRWVRSLSLNKPDVFKSFVLTIKSSNVLMPQLDSFSGNNELKKTFNLLTTEPVIPSPEFLGDRKDLERYEDTVHNEKNKFLLSETAMKKQIRRTVKELCRNAPSWSTNDMWISFFPSTRSNSINTVSEGGSIASLEEMLELLRTPDDLVELRDVKVEVENPVPIIDFEKRRVLKGELEFNNFIESWKELLEDGELDLRVETIGSFCVPDKLLDRFDELTKMVAEVCTYTSNEVSLVLLFESLKFRVISKGNPYHYFISRCLQKKLFDIMSKTKVFELIKKSVSVDIVEKRMVKLFPGEKWNSGDYDNATNEQFSFTTDVALDAVCEILKIPESLKVHFRQSLTLHLIQDPETSVLKPQLNGQLMGSILSFPFLCIVNAAICRWAMEIGEGRTITLRKARLLINGDDNLFPISLKGRDAWVKIAAMAGFNVNVGKSHYDQTIMSINSMEYRYSDKCFSETKKVHLSLFLGKGKTAQTQSMTTETIGQIATELIEKAPEMVQSRLLQMFIIKHRSLLDECGPRSWFSPYFVGGVGLPRLNALSVKDRRVAETVLLNYSKMPIPKPIGLVPWNVHKLAMKRMPTFKTGFQTITAWSEKRYVSQDLEANDVRLYALFCIETLFRYPLKKLKVAEDQKKGDQRINAKIQKIVLYARDHCCGGEGMTDWDLELYKPIPTHTIVVFGETRTERYLREQNIVWQETWLSPELPDWNVPYVESQ